MIFLSTLLEFVYLFGGLSFCSLYVLRFSRCVIAAELEEESESRGQLKLQ